MRNKWIAVLLIVALYFSVIPTAAFAADTDLNVTITTESGNAVDSLRAGDTVTVTVTLPYAAQVGGATVQLQYDNSKLEVKDAVTDMTSVNKNAIADKVTANHLNFSMENDAMTTETILLKVSFAVKADVVGTASFQLTQVDMNAYGDNAAIINLGFTAPAAETVKICEEITGTLPVSITTPSKNAVPQSAIAEGAGYTGTITWEPAVSSKFAANTVYTAKVTLKANEYYSFASDAAVSVEGANVNNVVVADDGSKMSFDAVFAATADKTLTGLTITTAPVKTDYVEGQNFDATGMVVKATYDDGSVDNNFTGYTVDGGTNLTTGVTTVTVKAGDCIAEQEITVKGKTISSIAVSGEFKKEYVIGDEADWTGMVVTAIYNDGASGVLSNDAYTVTGFDSTVYAQQQTIMVKAGQKTDTFTISIGKKTLAASDFTVMLPDNCVYDNSTKAVTVKSNVNGIGEISVKYNSSTDIPVDAGTYTITIDVAEGSDYQAITGIAGGTLVVEKAQPVIDVDSNKTIVIGNSAALNTNIQPAGLPLTYSSADESKVTVDTLGKITAVAVTDIPVNVTVTFAGNQNYKAVSETVAITVSEKHPVAVTFTDAAARIYQPEGYLLGEQFTAANCEKGTVTYYFDNQKYTDLQALSAVTVTDADTYTVKAVYEDAEYYGEATADFIISKANQEALLVKAESVQFGDTVALDTTGGSGTGAVTYTVTNGTGAAMVDGALLIPVQAGEVVVVAEKEADNNYNAITSEAQTIVITKADKVALNDKVIHYKTGSTGEQAVSIAEAMPSDAGTLQFTSGTATGVTSILATWDVSKDGVVSYTLSGDGATGDTVTMPISIQSDNYENSMLYVIVTITAKDVQNALVISSENTVTYGETLTLTTIGGSGSGKISYTVTNGTGEATIEGNVLEARKAGTVIVTAIKAEDAEYSAVSSDEMTITIQKAIPSGEPAYQAIATSGQTLADAKLTSGSITTSGAIAWDMDNATEVLANTRYDWTFTPDDTINYEVLTGSIELWHKEISPPGSSENASSSGGGFSGKYNYPVNIAEVDGADVTADQSYAVAGETVTITVDPDAGKQVDEVIVTGADGDVIPVTKVGDNKYSFTMPAGKINVTVITEAADYDLRIVMQINNKNILVNNNTITNDVAPVIVGDRTMVPIRVVTETLGGAADWNADTQSITLKIDGKVLTMTIGKVIPGFDVAPVIINDRTYVPIRYVAEKLGANVEWIAETQQIIIEQ